MKIYTDAVIIPIKDFYQIELHSYIKQDDETKLTSNFVSSPRYIGTIYCNEYWAETCEMTKNSELTCFLNGNEVALVIVDNIRKLKK